jgi:hypothetical protein
MIEPALILDFDRSVAPFDGAVRAASGTTSAECEAARDARCGAVRICAGANIMARQLLSFEDRGTE